MTRIHVHHAKNWRIFGPDSMERGGQIQSAVVKSMDQVADQVAGSLDM